MRSRLFTLLFALAALMLLACCDDGRVYDRYADVHVEGWRSADTLVFNIPKQQPGRYRLDVGLRYTTDFPFKSLYIGVDRTLLGKKHTLHETLNLPLLDDDGHMLGDEGVSNCVINFHVSEVNLQQTDSLRITIHHLMQRDPMPGITGVEVKLCRVG